MLIKSYDCKEKLFTYTFDEFMMDIYVPICTYVRQQDSKDLLSECAFTLLTVLNMYVEVALERLCHRKL
jgi:hypothetical protein